MMVPAPRAAQFYGRTGGFLRRRVRRGKWGRPRSIVLPRVLAWAWQSLRPRAVSPLNGPMRARRGPGGYCRASGNQGTPAHLPAAQEATPGAASRRGPTTGATKCKTPREGRSLARPPSHEGKTCPRSSAAANRLARPPRGGDPLARPSSVRYSCAALASQQSAHHVGDVPAQDDERQGRASRRGQKISSLVIREQRRLPSPKASPEACLFGE